MDRHGTLAGLRDLRLTPAAILTMVLTAALALLAFIAANPWAMLACGCVGGLLVWPLLRGVNLRRLHVRMDGPTRAVVGEQVQHEIVVTNHHRAPSAPLVLTVQTPGFADTVVAVPSIPAQRRVRVPLQRTAIARAASSQSLVHAAADDAFGLTAFNAVWVEQTDLLVHPALARPATHTPVNADALDDSAVLGTQRGGEFAGVRPWRRGDSRRHVHWRSTAKHGKLVVVERVASVSRGVAVAVIGQPTGPADEHLLSVASATADAQLRAHHPVCLIAVAATMMGRGPDDPQMPRQLMPATIIQSRDWFARLDRVGVPGPVDLLSALPPQTGTLAVAICASVPPSWLLSLREAAAAARVELEELGRVTS